MTNKEIQDLNQIGARIMPQGSIYPCINNSGRWFFKGTLDEFSPATVVNDAIMVLKEMTKKKCKVHLILDSTVTIGGPPGFLDVITWYEQPLLFDQEPQCIMLCIKKMLTEEIK